MTDPFPPPARALLDDDDDDDDERERRPDRMSHPERRLFEKHREIFISEGVSPRLTKRIIPQLLWLDTQSDDPIRLFINTPGGSADDGFAIHDAIRFIRSPVICISYGLNASAGTIILLSTPHERRMSWPNCRIMMHQPAGGARGKASDIEITAEQIIKLRARTNSLISEECDKPIEEVEKDTNRDFWLTPSEAVEYGLISKILTSLNDL